MKKYLWASIVALTCMSWGQTAFAAVTWTCTRNFEMLSAGGIIEAGSCSASGTVSAGGDALGATASVADTAAALCGSASRVLKDVIVTSGSAPAGATSVTFNYDHTNRLLQAYATNAAASTLTAQAQATTLTITSYIVQFVAFCQS